MICLFGGVCKLQTQCLYRPASLVRHALSWITCRAKVVLYFGLCSRPGFLLHWFSYAETSYRFCYGAFRLHTLKVKPELASLTPLRGSRKWPLATKSFRLLCIRACWRPSISCFTNTMFNLSSHCTM